MSQLSIIHYRRLFISLIALFYVFRIGILSLYSDNLDGSITPDSKEYIWLAQNFTDAYETSNSSNPYLSFRRTPIYPLFLNLFSQGNGLFASLLTQQILSIGIVLLTWLLCRRLFSEKIAWVAALLTVVETSLLTSSFMLLSEILFTFLFLAGIYLFVYAQASRLQGVTYALSGVFFGLSALTRPIGIAIMLILLLHLLLTKDIKRFKSLITVGVTAIPIIFWSIRNFLSIGVFDVSSIQSHNLHLFEGSGSKAYRLGIPLDEVHAMEKNIMNQTIGENFTLQEEQRYRTTRGLTLIIENFPWFIKMHLIGAMKLLIGPGQGDSLSFLTNGKVFSATETWQYFLVGALLSITLAITIMAAYGLFRKNQLSQPIVLISIVVIITMSSGIQAYSRFRAPIAPLLCIFAAVGIDRAQKKIRKSSRFRLL